MSTNAEEITERARQLQMSEIGRKMEAGELSEDDFEKDPTLLDKMLGEAEKTAESEAPKVEATQEEKDEKKAEAEAGAQDDKGEQDAGKTEDSSTKVDEVKADGVLAKDGKNVIPYSVLEKARATANELQTRLAAAEAALEAEKKGKATKEEAPADKGTAEVDAAADTTDADIEKLREEGYPPELLKVLVNANNRAKAAEALVNKRESVVVAEQKKTVQETIDSNPDLADWQASHDDFFQYAIARDKELMKDPAWKDKPLAERFEKAAALTRTRFDLQSKTAVDDKKGAEKTETKTEVKAKVPGDKTPRSLSDLPGGTARAQSEAEKIENMGISQLGDDLLKMDDQTLDKYLRENT